MSLADNIHWRRVPPPGVGPSERYLEYWRVFRCSLGGKVYDCLIGLKPGTQTVSQSSPIAHTDPQLPVVHTVSGRRYYLMGMPATEGACSLYVETCVTAMREGSGLTGDPAPIDVTDEYWAQWCDGTRGPA